MSLIDNITPSRIDFRIAGMSHYCDGAGAHMGFGEDSLQHICNAFYMVREFQRRLGVQPQGSAPGTLRGPPCSDPETVGYQIETAMLIKFAGHRMEYLARTRDGVFGGWLHAWDGNPACIADTPQEYADLADAVITWCGDNFSIFPEAAEPE